MKNVKGTIDIDSERLSLLSDLQTTATNKIDFLVDNSQTSYKPLKRAGVYSDGTEKVEKGYEDIRQSLKDCLKVLGDYYTDLDSLEKELILAVESIEIPNSYKLNQSFSMSNPNIIQLSKEDGTAIKPDNLGVDFEEVKTGDDMEKVMLKNILADSTKSVEYVDATNELNKEKLQNISKAQEFEVKQLDDQTNIDREEMLERLKTEGDLEIRQADEQSLIDKANILQNIKNNNVAVEEEFEIDNKEDKIEDNFSLEEEEKPNEIEGQQ